MKFVLFGASVLNPAGMVLAATRNESGFTTNATFFVGAPYLPVAVAAQRVIVTGKITAEAIAILAAAELTKEKLVETEKLGAMLTSNASFVDIKAIADPANGDAIANKGGYDAKEGAVHHEDVPIATAHFSVAAGVLLGEANLHCDVIKNYGGITYKYYYSLNVATPVWVLGDAGTNSMTLHALPTGVPIAFKVVGNNINGPGTSSAVIVKTLPTA